MPAFVPVRNDGTSIRTIFQGGIGHHRWSVQADVRMPDPATIADSRCVTHSEHPATELVAKVAEGSHETRILQCACGRFLQTVRIVLPKLTQAQARLLAEASCCADGIEMVHGAQGKPAKTLERLGFGRFDDATYTFSINTAGLAWCKTHPKIVEKIANRLSTEISKQKRSS
jgi:hypothetical protein